MEKGLFDSLYTRFILRDFLGKIVPGTGLSIWLAKEANSFNAVVSFLKELPTPAWIIGLGFGWLVGLALQSFGELTGLFLYWPRDAVAPVDRMVVFDATVSDGMRHQVERLRVMKEACGTAAIVFLVMFAIISLRFAWALFVDGALFNTALQTYWLEWCVSLAMFCLLQRMHREHVRRQDLMMASVLGVRPVTPTVQLQPEQPKAN
jgi:hypothetical protein